MVFGRVYGLYDPLSNELRYVGQTIRPLKERLRNHLHDARRRKGRHVLHWIRNLLENGQRPTIGLLGEADTRGALDAMEKSRISEARAKGVGLLNHSDGGLGSQGRKLSEAHKLKLHSPEVVARMALTRKGQPSPRKGVKLSAETRAKVSAAKMGNRCRLRQDISTADMLRLRSQGLSFERVGRLLGVSKTTVMKRLAGRA